MEAIKTNNRSWFRHWFNSSFYHKLYANRNEQEAADLIDALLAELQPAPGASIMDLGCGAGRHAKYLASKGFDVTGTDLAFSSIKTAMAFHQPNLRFYQHDMRNSFGNNHFDYVCSFFTSFGYFKTGEENLKVISNISAALKPGGVLVMDYLNAHYAEKHLVSSEEKEIDAVIYQLSRWTDQQYFYKKIAIENTDGKLPLEYTEQVAKLYLHNFEYLFKCNGLQLQAVYGDYQLNTYDVETSPRMLLIAIKK